MRIVIHKWAPDYIYRSACNRYFGVMRLSGRWSKVTCKSCLHYRPARTFGRNLL